MRWMRRVSVVATVGLALAVSGCGSKSSTKASIGSPASTASTTAPKSPAKGGVTVDLTFTGADSASVKGTKGRCVLPSATAAGSFYELAGSDYPSIGANGFFGVYGPTTNASTGNTATAYIKALISDQGFLTDAAGITFSSDYKTVTLDKDMQRYADRSNPSGGTVTTHVKGTITCS